MLGCRLPMSAKGQLETFQNVITETLGEDCDYETIRNLHENLHEWMEEAKESPDPVELTGRDVKILLEQSGAPDEKIQNFEEEFQEIVGENQTFLASNLTAVKKVHIETPDVVIQVSPERMDLVETKMIDGKKCLVIPVDDYIEVNGIQALTMKSQKKQKEETEK